jgi:hypothetical protein
VWIAGTDIKDCMHPGIAGALQHLGPVAVKLRAIDVGM